MGFKSGNHLWEKEGLCKKCSQICADVASLAHTKPIFDLESVRSKQK